MKEKTVEFSSYSTEYLDDVIGGDFSRDLSLLQGKEWLPSIYRTEG